MTIFGVLSLLEREKTFERQKEGKYKGRQPIKIDRFEFEGVYVHWKDGNIIAKTAMSRLNLKPNTFYRRAKEFKGLKNIA